ncbi:MBL fold metallo-hydrolase [Acidihalobacter prosperus]|uniref:Zn-dependent hydrolase n=1 Tax=Acidihalobacter prosperus TaxID=160660 RepID=A0A1A6C4N9_9GAMM|nr:MBL fold metallo-hydrolase [Acidihalobacter prosperus]OBS09519.1 Zn-dependent hydrolase [Acidihalobacter prosperus]
MGLFRQLFDDDSSTLSYLIADEVSREALIIDPVLGQVARDLALIRECGLTLRHVVETHVHADHVTGAARLREATGASVVVGAAAGVDCADRAIGNGETLQLGGETLIAMATPGHTRGCTSYRWRDRVFTGDTLLIGGCGRTDFQQGDAGQLYDSLQRLLALPGETLVYPAHDYAGRRVSCIDEERRLNSRIAGRDREAFVALMGGLRLPYPRRIDEALPANEACGRARRKAAAAPV